MATKTTKVIVASFATLLLLAVIVCLLVYYLGIHGGSKTTSRASQKLRDMYDEYQQWRLSTDPEFATNRGVVKYNDKLRSYTLSSYQAMYDRSVEFLQRAKDMRHLVENEADIINLDTFTYDVTMFVEGYKYKGFMFALTNRDGPQVDLAKVVAATRLQEERDYRLLLARYSAFPRQTEELIELLRQGMKEGRTPHKYSMTGVESQFDGIQVPYEQSPFYKPFINIPDTVTAEAAVSLREEAKEVLQEKLLPAFKHLGDFISEEYTKSLRAELASSSLPDGQNFYKQCVKYHTSTDLTPEEIHQLGLEEVQRITKEMKKIIEELGLNITVREFSEKLRHDERFYFSDTSDIIEAFRNITNDVIIPKLTRIVHRIPAIKMIIEPMPSASANGSSAYHISGSVNGRPGKFVVNTADVKTQPKYEMMTLSLHEGYPGHHLQSSYLLELPGLPDFRKNVGDGGCATYSNAPSCYAMHGAYNEGWALYAEDLGFALGVFDDLYTRYGHYSWEIFRACRLVVDTGLHAFGWSKDQAVKYMRDHTAASLRVIKNEVDRYVTWPGQACSYKMGELKIQELKKKTKEKLAERFNIKDFHEVMLKCAGPLFIVEKCVDRYINLQVAN